MTSVKVYNSDSLHEITAKGHATGDERVCASVSTLLYALGEWLHHYGDSGKQSITLESANAKVVSWEASEAVKTAFEVISIGLYKLSKVNPDAIKII